MVYLGGNGFSNECRQSAVGIVESVDKLYPYCEIYIYIHFTWNMWVLQLNQENTVLRPGHEEEIEFLKYYYFIYLLF